MLGDDAEDASVTTSTVPVTAPAVKKTTSTKKSDENPRANPAKANPNRPKPTGNEAAFRDKNVARGANRSRPADESTGARPRRGAPADRKPRDFKKDSDKKVRQGWGDDNKKASDEAAGEAIAKSEDAAEGEDAEGAAAAPAEEEDNTQTLEEYLAELKVKNAALESARQGRKPNEGVEDSKWANASTFQRAEEDDVLVPASQTKSLRQKNRKEKQVIEPEITFSSPRSDRPPRGGDRGDRGDRDSRRPRGGAASGSRGRGGNAGGRGAASGARGRGGRPAAGAKGSVNVTSNAEFPTLGA